MPAPDAPSLFDLTPPLPEGFRYADDVITADEERDLIRHIEPLPLKQFEFQGFTGRRRTISFGWRYDFDDRTLLKADDIPPFLLPLRDRAAAFAGLPPDDLRHVLVTEYAAGAAIGWHRDKGVFDAVVGISLAAPARFRLRRRAGTKWERAEVLAHPRSAYLLTGPARSDWEHSIPPVEQLRYSITWRTLR